jgi:hypothetical protein
MGDGGDYSIPASKNSAIISQAGGIRAETVSQFLLLFSGETSEIWPDFGKGLNLAGCRETYDGRSQWNKKLPFDIMHRLIKCRNQDFSQLSLLSHFFLKICPLREHSKNHSNQLMGRRQ